MTGSNDEAGGTASNDRDGDGASNDEVDLATSDNGTDGTIRIELRFYAPFKDAVDEKSVVQELPQGATVGDAFARAVEAYPDLDGKLLDDSGAIQDGVRVLRNGHARADADTRLEDGDEISLTTPIHGG